VSELTDSLTYKLGPLPAWAWGLSAGAAILAVQAFRRRNAPVPADPATGTEALPPEVVTGGGAYDPFTMSPSPMGGGSWATAPRVPDPADDDTEVSKKPTTNDEWRRAASDWLITEGYSATLVSDSLVRFLDGLALNAQQKAAVNAAIRRWGVPPQGAPPIIDQPGPVVTPPPPSATQRPGAPRDVRVVHRPGTGTDQRSTAHVGWAPPTVNGGSAVTGYKVEWEAQSYPGRWSTAPVTASTFVEVKNLSPGISVRFRVTAINAKGAGTPTTTAYSTTATKAKPTPPPAKPSNPTPPAKPPPAPADNLRTIRSGDTLWNMTKSVYGNVSTSAVEQVATHNRLQWRGSGSSRYVVPFTPGQVVRFPPKSTIKF
jgi:hypothetical protein